MKSRKAKASAEAPERLTRARAVLAGGVDSPVRDFNAVGGSPVFARSGKGATLTDADGRKYLDYCLSWGPLILGHAHKDVVLAASAISVGE